jgi:Uma2 family endonuclease
MTLTVTETGPLVLQLPPAWQAIGDREFDEFCQMNPDWRIERTARGDLIVMPPAGGETGKREFILALRFGNWAEADGTGIGFSPSTGFTLPNGAKRSPDVAWVRRERWQALTGEERETFPPLCPDFVVELRSRSDSLTTLQDKMAEYIANGAQLGWLIDPLEKKVYVYQPAAGVVCLEDPHRVSGDPVLPGFVLEMRAVWGD